MLRHSQSHWWPCFKSRLCASPENVSLKSSIADEISIQMCLNLCSRCARCWPCALMHHNFCVNNSHVQEPYVNISGTGVDQLYLLITCIAAVCYGFNQIVVMFKRYLLVSTMKYVASITVTSHDGHGVSDHHQTTFRTFVSVNINKNVKVRFTGFLCGESIGKKPIPWKWFTWHDTIMQILRPI